jgi:hypothetical protein
MHLIIIQLQRQINLRFLADSQVSKILAQSIFFIEDRIMTLASMHPMFQVSIELCNFSPIRSRKSTFTYSCACQAEVAVSAESKLQSWNCRSYWNLELSIRVSRLESNYASIVFANYSHYIFWHALFGEAFTMKGENFAKHIFVKCPKTQQKKNFFDDQNGVWQMLKTWIFNTGGNSNRWHPPSYSHGPELRGLW